MCSSDLAFGPLALIVHFTALDSLFCRGPGFKKPRRPEPFIQADMQVRITLFTAGLFIHLFLYQFIKMPDCIKVSNLTFGLLTIRLYYTQQISDSVFPGRL